MFERSAHDAEVLFPDWIGRRSKIPDWTSMFTHRAK
jgi:hypothetical protein